MNKNMLPTEQHTALHRAEKAEATVLCLRQALRRVPRGMGDHTDLCRMENNGTPPRTIRDCRCHVGPVRQALESC